MVMDRMRNIARRNFLGCLLAAAVVTLLFLVISLLFAVIFSDRIESWAGELADIVVDPGRFFSATFNSGLLVGLLVFGFVGAVLLVSVVVAGFGVCLGMYLAYGNERRKKRMECRRTDIKAVLETVLHLQMMCKDIRDYDSQVIDPVRDHPVRHVRMQPAATTGENHDLPWSDLAFLMHTSPNILLQISDTQMAYRRWREVVRMRNRDHERRVQPELEGIVGSLDEAATREALGQGLDQAMRVQTKMLIEHTTRLDRELAQTMVNLRSAVLEIYPGVWFPWSSPPE